MKSAPSQASFRKSSDTTRSSARGSARRSRSASGHIRVLMPKVMSARTRPLSSASARRTHWASLRWSRFQAGNSPPEMSRSGWGRAGRSWWLPFSFTAGAPVSPLPPGRPTLPLSASSASTARKFCTPFTQWTAEQLLERSETPPPASIRAAARMDSAGTPVSTAARSGGKCCT